MILSTENYCRKILTTTRCSQLPFHNIDHTLEVVDNIQTIGDFLNLSEIELEPIIIAGWFHDIGFCEAYRGHEEVSIKMAKQFLQKNSYDPEKLELVISCINATKMPQNPSNEFAKIICDADVFHIGTTAFFYRKLLLRREWEIECNQKSTDFEWHELNLKFLETHNFFTPYGKTVLMKGKLINEAKIKNLIKYY